MPARTANRPRKPKASPDHDAETVLFRLDAAELAFLRQCLAPVRDLLQGLGQATTTLDRVLATAPGQALEGVFKGPSKPLQRTVQSCKIEADPELRAFVQSRIRTMTFPACRDAIAAAFPPERWVSVSSIHRWWHLYGKHDG